MQSGTVVVAQQSIVAHERATKCPLTRIIVSRSLRRQINGKALGVVSHAISLVFLSSQRLVSVIDVNWG